jgi:hypothetical protein
MTDIEGSSSSENLAIRSPPELVDSYHVITYSPMCMTTSPICALVSQAVCTRKVWQQ